MNINIMAGGPIEHLPNLQTYLNDNSFWVGVDRGVYQLLKRDIKPMIAFGDFDSVNPVELKEIEKSVKELKRFKPEKDETDLDLALQWAINQSPDSIKVFGATGGRLDHLFGNVQLLIHAAIVYDFVEIEIIDRQNHLFVKGSGCYQIKKIPDKKYISFVPATENISNLTLDGFKYPLKNHHISIGSTLCISNELISDYGTFSFSEGILIVIRSHD